MKLQKGYIQVYTGEGKGKTSAALGLAVRAIGHGLRVYMLQFLKAPLTSGEHYAFESLSSSLKIRSRGKKGFILKKYCDPLDTVMAQLALQEAKEAMLSLEYDIVILDEINMAVHLQLVELEDLLDFMDHKPKRVELILTGRYARPEVVARADLVSEIVPIKHYYDRGVKARRGIEY